MEVAPDDNGQGNLFKPEEFGKVEEKIKKIQPRKQREPKPVKPKPVKNPSEDKLNIIWKKVTGLFSDSFENTLGELYDDMGNNNEGRQ